MQQYVDIIKQLQEDVANMRQQLEYWRNVNKAASPSADTAANNQFNYKRLYYCHRTMEFLDRARKILWDRLQPGQLKHGNWNLSGSSPMGAIAFQKNA